MKETKAPRIKGKSATQDDLTIIERVSEAEQDVMEVLWQDAPLSATDIAKRLKKTRNWQETTVKTLLNRLASKKVVHFEKEGRRYLYRPAFERKIFIQAESKRMIDRLFGGKVSPLVAHLAQYSDLSDQDIADLERIVEGLKDNAD